MSTNNVNNSGTTTNVAGIQQAARAYGGGSVTDLYPRAAVSSARTTYAAAQRAENHFDSHVRNVAARYTPDQFKEALLPMVLASGVKPHAAGPVVDAILSNPNLLAQAKKAFNRAHSQLESVK
jgi:hypothetical protein